MGSQCLGICSLSAQLIESGSLETSIKIKSGLKFHIPEEVIFTLVYTITIDLTMKHRAWFRNSNKLRKLYQIQYSYFMWNSIFD